MTRTTRLHLVTGVIVAVLGTSLIGCSDASSGGAQVATTKLTLLPTTTTTLAPATTSTTTTSTTTTSTTTTSTTTSTVVDDSTPSFAALELSAEGIGAASFSSEPEGVIAYLSSFFGSPTTDTGWVDPFTIGSCSGNELRVVTWGALSLTFGDVSHVLDGRRHFYAFAYGEDAQPGTPPVGLATDHGITLGTRLIDLLAAHPGAVLNPSDDFTPPNFVINSNLRGYLSGLADDSVVTAIFGGQGCGE